MALGKNMKIDRLIPLKKEVSKVNEETTAIDEGIVENTFGEFKLDESQTVTADIAASDSQVGEIPKESITPEDASYANIETESIKIIFTPSRRKTQKRILITIEGSLTINNVELLYSKVNSVFEKYDFVEVTMNNISEIDLTVVQLFHAIRVIYWPLKKYISINAEFSRDDRKLLNTCGFTEFQTQKVAEA